MEEGYPPQALLPGTRLWIPRSVYKRPSQAYTAIYIPGSRVSEPAGFGKAPAPGKREHNFLIF